MELKPCPFCAQEGKIFHYELSEYNRSTLYNKYSVECESCEATTPEYANKEQAISHWNTRTEKK